MDSSEEADHTSVDKETSTRSAHFTYFFLVLDLVFLLTKLTNQTCHCNSFSKPLIDNQSLLRHSSIEMGQQ